MEYLSVSHTRSKLGVNLLTYLTSFIVSTASPGCVLTRNVKPFGFRGTKVLKNGARKMTSNALKVLAIRSGTLVRSST